MVKDGAPSEQVFVTVRAPPGLPTVYMVSSLGLFAAVADADHVSFKATASPASTSTPEKLKVVSPLGVEVVVPLVAPLTRMDAVTVIDAARSIWTVALVMVAAAEALNVCVSDPPGVDSGRLGLPAHIGVPAVVAGP